VESLSLTLKTLRCGNALRRWKIFALEADPQSVVTLSGDEGEGDEDPPHDHTLSGNLNTSAETKRDDATDHVRSPAAAASSVPAASAVHKQHAHGHEERSGKKASRDVGQDRTAGAARGEMHAKEVRSENKSKGNIVADDDGGHPETVLTPEQASTSVDQGGGDGDAGTNDASDAPSADELSAFGICPRCMCVFCRCTSAGALGNASRGSGRSTDGDTRTHGQEDKSTTQEDDDEQDAELGRQHQAAVHIQRLYRGSQGRAHARRKVQEREVQGSSFVARKCCAVCLCT
jgi:hypothetical protein